MNKQADTSIFPITLLGRFLCYFLIGSSAVLAIHFYYEYQRFNTQKEELQYADSVRLTLAAKTLTRDLQTVVADLRWLSHSQALRDYLADNTPNNAARLQTDIKNFAKYTALYDQIRYIDAKGWERIRINFNDGAPIAVPDNELQNKAKRYYFSDTLALDRNRIYFSPLDLNIENGEIEQPFKPMLRVGMPVFVPDADKPAGILVLNYLAAHLLKHFGNVMTDSWGQAMLLNNQGYWLYCSNPDDEWGFMRHNDKTFAKRYPLAWSTITKQQSGTIANEEGLFNYVRLSPLADEGLTELTGENPEYIWTAVTQVALEKLVFPARWNIDNYGRNEIFMISAVAVLSLILALLRQLNIQHAKALQESEIRYRNTLENMAEGYILQQALYGPDKLPYDYRFLDANPACERLLNVKRTDIIGKTLLEVFPDTEPHWLNAFGQVAVSGNALRLVQYGNAFDCYFEITASSPEPGLVAVFFFDVTERKRAEERLHQDATVFSNTQEAIIITDAKQNIVRVNEAYSHITGFSVKEALGKNPSLHQSGQHDRAFYDALWQSLHNDGQWQGEIWNRRKNGELFPSWESINAIKDETGRITHYVAIMSDISPIKQAEEQLEYLAHHDALTGLPNRMMLELTLNKILQRARRHQQRLALLFLDLNGFKPVNDNYGHAMGDHLLKVIGDRLKTCVRSADIASRIGGDEFIVVFDELSDITNTQILAQRIAEAVAEPIQLNGHELAVSASIGISIFPDNADTVEGLIKKADAAMYVAKTDKSSYRFFSEPANKE